jgi:hypothetical protein
LLSPGNNSILSPESLELTRDANAAAAAAAAASHASPTPPHHSSGIRVRQDLMQHLGLVARSSANIVQTTTADRSSVQQQPRAHQPTSQQPLLQISAVAAPVATTTVIPPSLQLSTTTAVKLPPSVVAQTIGATNTGVAVSATPNLAKLLSESIGGGGANDAAAVALSAPVGHRSSNAQLFKSSESSSGTAIPLTFNNSIAEVLAAAASKANKLNNVSSSREPSPKPEITITAKSSLQGGRHQFASSALGGGATGGGPTKFSVLKQGAKTQASGLCSSSGGGIVTVSTAGGGGTFIGGSGSLSILKRPIGGGAVQTTESGGGVNPISNMTKLLQAQAPGLPPHIIAQQALPSRSSPKVKTKRLKLVPVPLYPVA